MRTPSIALSTLLIPWAFCAFSPGQDKECRATDESAIATASHSNKLKYRSGKGDHCLIYKVKNEDKGLFMPVRWKHGDTVLIECRVPRGPTDWIEFTRTSNRQDQGDTVFTYGANYDEFTDKPRAFRDDPAQMGAQPLTCTIKGKFADSKENVYPIDLTISSLNSDAGARLRYVFKNGNKASPVQLAIHDTDLKASQHPRILWKPAQGKDFATAVKETGLKPPLVLTSNLKSQPFAVGIAAEADEIAVYNDVLRVVVFPDDKEETLLSVTVPSYGSRNRSRFKD